MHVKMALKDNIWLFHRKVAQGHYELIAAPKQGSK